MKVLKESKKVAIVPSKGFDTTVHHSESLRRGFIPEHLFSSKKFGEGITKIQVKGKWESDFDTSSVQCFFQKEGTSWPTFAEFIKKVQLFIKKKTLS